MAKAKTIKTSALLKRNGALEVHDGKVYAILISIMSATPTVLVRGRVAMTLRDFVPGSYVTGTGHGGKFQGWEDGAVTVREAGSSAWSGYPTRLENEIVTLEEYRTAPTTKLGTETRYHLAQYANDYTWQKLGAKGWLDIDSVATRVAGGGGKRRQAPKAKAAHQPARLGRLVADLNRLAR